MQGEINSDDLLNKLHLFDPTHVFTECRNTMQVCSSYQDSFKTEIKTALQQTDVQMARTTHLLMLFQNINTL